MFIRVIALLIFICCSTTLTKADSPRTIAEVSLDLFSVQGNAKNAVVDELLRLGGIELAPTFILAMRLTGNNRYVANALSQLTGQNITTWHEAYNWQELHPEIQPHASFRTLKLRFLGNTDRRFLNFFQNSDGSQKLLKIRLEEIHWGGVRLDDIIPLDSPPMMPASLANYLLDDDLVFGIDINGDKRAYPLRIMGWHEMMNDTVGGVPVSLTYCTLCGAGILYEGHTGLFKKPFTFSTSGLLYRSNKLMYDRQTKSLWNQFTGRPVSGHLVNTDIALKSRPIVTITWQRWKKDHPNSQVLDLSTGFNRNYDSGIAYKDYFASPDLMFPVAEHNESLLNRKDRVFGIHTIGASRAWPLSSFVDSPVINDQIGSEHVVLVGTPDSRSVRAFRRPESVTFTKNGQNHEQLRSQDGATWNITENFLESTVSDARLARLSGHLSYWFAWESYYRVRSTLFSPLQKTVL